VNSTTVMKSSRGDAGAVVRSVLASSVAGLPKKSEKSK
jgi:hypothetical protein